MSPAVEIVVAICGVIGLHCVTTCGLAYAKLRRQWGIENAEWAREDTTEKEANQKKERERQVLEIKRRREQGDVPEILPYVAFATGKGGSRCPKCGTISEIKGNRGPDGVRLSQTDRGVVRMPQACRDPELCLLGDKSHLHVSCITCNTTWPMAPKHAEKKSAAEGEK